MPEEMEGVHKQFAQTCSTELMDCGADPAAHEPFAQLSAHGDVPHIVSGGLEAELSATPLATGLAPNVQSFSSSPRSEGEILNDLGAITCDDGTALLSDSEENMRVVLECDLRRVFVTQRTKFAKGQNIAKRNADFTVWTILFDFMSMIDTIRPQ